MPKVVFLGAGVCGLAAAMRLGELRPDWEMTILEGADRPGGLAINWGDNEFTADLGPHRIFTELPEIERLLPDLIGAGSMITVQRRSQLMLDGQMLEYPARPLELLKHLGPVRMGLLGASAVAGRLRGSRRPPGNFEDAMSDAFGRRAYDLLVGPYAEKVWKTPPTNLSKEVARVRVSAGDSGKMIKSALGGKKEPPKPTALKEFRYVRGGVENLVRSLRERATKAGAAIHLGERATGLRISPSGRVESVLTESGDEVSAGTDGFVVSTIPVTDLDTMVQAARPDPAAVEAARHLVYLGMVLVGVVINRERFTPNTWIYFPDKHLIFNRAYEPKNFDESMATAGQTLVVFEVTDRWDGDLWRLPDDEIARRVVDGLVSTGLATRADIARTITHRIAHTYPLYTAEFRDHLDVVCHHLAQVPNLVSTGRQGLFNHNNMDHSMLMGIRAAECIAEGGNAGARWHDNLGQFSHFRIVD